MKTKKLFIKKQKQFTKKQKPKHKKNKKHRTIKKNKKISGGNISVSNIFQNIKSIGFEIETTDLIKFTIEKEKEGDKDILVNSALTNIDLEYGYYDETEYTYIIDEPNLKFKITNDSADDSEFNKRFQSLISSHKKIDEHDDDEEHDGDEAHDNEDEEDDYEGEDECEDVVFKLNIPSNKYLKQTEYDILVKEPDLELHKCSTFTDVEWIITYYDLTYSKNIILNNFFNSMSLLKQHLNKLVTINNSKFVYLNAENKYVELDDSIINQAYVLPDTSLVYYNVSEYDIPKYNITTDLKFVPQMTFSCDITYTFRIMKKILSLEYDIDSLKIVKNYLAKINDTTNIKTIDEMIENHLANENFDVYSIDFSIKIINRLFKNYNENETNKDYLLDDKESVNKLKMYLFLIIYKLYIYLNSYLETKTMHEETMLKKNLSFAVRHSNYLLYLEVKKILKNIFSSKFVGKSDKDINDEIVKIIHNLMDDKILSKLMYEFQYPKLERNKIIQNLINNKNNPEKYEEIKKQYYGDPLYLISSYFDHFEKPNLEEGEDETDESAMRDWLVFNNIDEKSTKFELNNDTIIIEFRDFPSYCYLHLFMTSDEKIRQEILQNNIGTLNMKIIDDYTQYKQLSTKYDYMQ